MIMRKETLVFLTSLAIIFIIGYINMTMTPENIFSEEDYAQLQDEISSEDSSSDLSQILENSSEEISGAELVEVMEQTDTTDIAVNSGETEEPEVPSESDTEASIAEILEEESDYVILGDITDILLDDDAVTASSEGIFDMLNSSFANFKLNKDKKNMDVIDHLEESISNESISAETKSQFEALLLNKNDFVEKENNIELMLQSKGYNETAVIVDSDTVKVVTNDKIEQADATKILDVIVSETSYEPEQIKIVKFDNIDL
ncbi:MULTISPECIES: SpoIIIAH-like family protein [unclassified Sedimentibacter]|uniref:SpoIIIAH-like family protein n=1 Tax=unclassified Sedimentibacter TaxID=2649220 RepID=UPI0027E04230|nr:SpoIIIAH-like family protein [Sedimentibacter sp. MB35-C1]WMJ76240.1 SpoIIIAH-like family protein [Sedimentibacter sp. MB35-C1]